MTSRLPTPTAVDLDGVAVATYVLEPPGEPAGDVVLCHGTPWRAEVWADLATALAAHHRVHLWDMPGYGRSEMRPDIAVDLPAQMRRLAALVAHRGLDRPHLIAHDVGGAVALGAHLGGLDLHSLFLWDVVTLDPWGSEFFRLVAQHEDVFAALPAPLHAALVRAYIGGATAADLPEPWLETLAEPWSTTAGQAAFYRQVAQLRPRDTAPVAAALADVRCPVRVGWGERDPWIPVEQAHRLAAALPGEVEVVLLPEAGHLTPVEDADGIRAAVLAWLAAVEAT